MERRVRTILWELFYKELKLVLGNPDEEVLSILGVNEQIFSRWGCPVIKKRLTSIMHTCCNTTDAN